ncbi:hypothetical protein [Streptomyces sp. NPDC059165]|uniref:hypothetical protein n=1 Tax=Streptomyces sp. NPDC059165 TaxID=3346751 RepID=UPI0036CE8209
MPYIELRGNSIRVKWWSGEYKLDAEGNPTKKKRYDFASGPEPGVTFQDESEAYTYGLDRESDVRNKRNRRKAVDSMNMAVYIDRWFKGTDLRANSNKTNASRLNAVIKLYWAQAYIWTVAFTGARPPGEMFGLQRGFSSPYWPASEPDGELREEAEQRYKAMHAMRVQYQTYVADKRHVLAAPKYDSWRTLVIPPFLHEIHEALLASHDKPWTFLSVTAKPLLVTSFDRGYWYAIRDGAERRDSGPRYARWVRPAMPAVSEMAGQDIYRLRHWHKAKPDEPGDIPRVAVEARMGHELPGVEGVYSEVTVAMEERIGEYLQRVWEKEVLGAGLWTPPSPMPLPDHLRNATPSLFSGLPVLECG